MAGYLLKEDASYLLLESGDKIILDTIGSPSASQSPSSSLSPSASASLSASPSSSLSPSSSASRSQSISPSSSISSSISSSLSPSSSASPSLSPSASSSASLSPSSSVSQSISASPSIGFSNYTRGDEGALPLNNNDLQTVYTDAEEEKVGDSDGIYVDQSGILQYMIHQFKTFVGSNTIATVEWEGRSDLDPTASTVYLQIYNEATRAWETLDTVSHYVGEANFLLTKTIRDLTSYKDASQVITCRVYQEAI